MTPKTTLDIKTEKHLSDISNLSPFSPEEEAPSHSLQLSCLANKDVITAKISDHQPLIHDGALFWNVMMQAKERRQNGVIVGFNNGFGLVESKAEYELRLIKVALVIAEIVARNPGIDCIGLCEGPIEAAHCELLMKTLGRFACMSRFLQTADFYKPSISGAPDWGLLVLTDARYSTSSVKCDLVEGSKCHSKLANRFHLLKLESEDTEKFFALAHFPFGGDERATDRAVLSAAGCGYADIINQLMEQYESKSLVMAADFNLNPHLIGRFEDRAADKVGNHNSILFSKDRKTAEDLTESVTVDGILLSRREKQKFYSASCHAGLFTHLKRERSLISFGKDHSLTDELTSKDASPLDTVLVERNTASRHF